MNNIKIYYQNDTRKGFQSLLLDVALYMKKFHDAELILVDSYQPLDFGNHSVHVLDCELLIHDVTNDSFKGISFADNETSMNSFFYQRDNVNDTFLMAHWGSKSFHNPHFKYNFRFIPTIYVPENPRINLDHYYIRRTLLTEFKDKMIFRGNVDPMGRGTADLLVGNEYFEGHNYVDDYFYDIINYKVGLALPGVAEFCHRDVEYMAIGLPILKFQYISDSNPPLIPNYHYISIDRIDDDIRFEREGGEQYKELYIKRFLEVKDDDKLLSFISKNAREYYVEHIHPLNILNKLITLLE